MNTLELSASAHLCANNIMTLYCMCVCVIQVCFEVYVSLHEIIHIVTFFLQRMVKDKKNYNQLTENQLKRKCDQFFSSPYVTLLQDIS